MELKCDSGFLFVVPNSSESKYNRKPRELYLIQGRSKQLHVKPRRRVITVWNPLIENRSQSCTNESKRRNLTTVRKTDPEIPSKENRKPITNWQVSGSSIKESKGYTANLRVGTRNTEPDPKLRIVSKGLKLLPESVPQTTDPDPSPEVEDPGNITQDNENDCNEKMDPDTMVVVELYPGVKLYSLKPSNLAPKEDASGSKTDLGNNNRSTSDVTNLTSKDKRMNSLDSNEEQKDFLHRNFIECRESYPGNKVKFDDNLRSRPGVLKANGIQGTTISSRARGNTEEKETTQNHRINRTARYVEYLLSKENIARSSEKHAYARKLRVWKPV